MLGHGALGEFAIGEFDTAGSPVYVTGPGWRRLASQRVLEAAREAEDEEALLLLLS